MIVDAQIHLWAKGKPAAHHRQLPYLKEEALAAMGATGSAGTPASTAVVPKSPEEGRDNLVSQAVPLRAMSSGVACEQSSASGM